MTPGHVSNDIRITPAQAPADTEGAFGLEVAQNKYRSVSDSGMAAVLRVTAPPSNSTTTGQPQPAAVVVLIDRSSSMGYPQAKMSAAKQATQAAIDTIRDGSRFAIVAGTRTTQMVYPAQATMAVASDTTRAEAREATGHLFENGGTAMGRWLRLANQLLDPYPELVRHVILLTDGRNEHEAPDELEEALTACAGHFVCDARGIGEDWDHHQLLRITSVLRGATEAIGPADDLVADFEAVMDRAMGKHVPDLRIRISTAPGVRLRSLRQETPVLSDLTEHAVVVDEQTTEFYTGSWTGAESRDFLLELAIAFDGDDDGDRPPVEEDLRAARVDLVLRGKPCADPVPVVLCWTNSPVAPTRIEPLVARHLGQEELGDAVATGCDALEAGDLGTAEAQFGLAVDLATRLGNKEVLRRLAGLVDVTGDPDRPVRVKENWGRSDLLRAAVSSVMSGTEDDQIEVESDSAVTAEPDRVCVCGRISPAHAVSCEACGREFTSGTGEAAE